MATNNRQFLSFFFFISTNKKKYMICFLFAACYAVQKMGGKSKWNNLIATITLWFLVQFMFKCFCLALSGLRNEETKIERINVENVLVRTFNHAIKREKDRIISFFFFFSLKPDWQMFFAVFSFTTKNMFWMHLHMLFIFGRLTEQIYDQTHIF